MAIASVPWLKYLEAHQQVLGHDNIGVNFFLLNQELS